MSASVSEPLGVVEGSRIARPPTCPLWRGVSSARNWASRLVSWRMAGGQPLGGPPGARRLERGERGVEARELAQGGRQPAAVPAASADRRAGEEEEPRLEDHDAQDDCRGEALLEPRQAHRLRVRTLTAHRAQPR